NQTQIVQTHPAEVRSYCAKILAGTTFADAPRLSRLLRYLVDCTLDGRQDSLKEYVIGVDVFERPPDFDPKLDSIVRVQVGRLRMKLGEYYESEGREDRLRIEIPKRSYAAVFQEPSVPQAAGQEVSAATPENSIAVLPFLAMSSQPEIA